MSLVALVLLVLGVSLVLSGTRSLRRSFDGFVLHKVENTGLLNSYVLYLVDQPDQSTVAVPAGVINVLATARMVGVGNMVYADAQVGIKVRKDPDSPWIWLESERYLDLGVRWILMGLFWAVLSLIVARQATAPTESPELSALPE